MNALTFKRATDEKHEIVLDSSFVLVKWKRDSAFAGQRSSFKILTAFVGQDAQIEIKGKSKNGINLGTIDGLIRDNCYYGSFDIPKNIELGDEIFFETKLPQNGLNSVSAPIAVQPMVSVTNLKWSATVVRRTDVLTLSAKVSGVEDNTEATVVVYEYDRDGAHDRIVNLPATVVNNKIDLEWKYQYHKDTDEIPTQLEIEPYGGQYCSPEYFFTVEIGSAKFGRNQESGLLAFEDWIDIKIEDEDGNGIADAPYVLLMADGQEVKGTSDGNGVVRIENIPPGKYTIEFENQDYLTQRE